MARLKVVCLMFIAADNKVTKSCDVIYWRNDSEPTLNTVMHVITLVGIHVVHMYYICTTCS